MEVQPDFKDLVALLKKHSVEFIIIGGYALAYHGAPRYTGDIDFFIKPDPGNAKKIVDALLEFGFRDGDLTLGDFHTPDQIIQIGVPPVRIDIMTSISGVSWEEASLGKEMGTFGDEPVYFLGLKEFIRNKTASGRKKDLADLEALGE